MNVLILGSAGQVGRALAESCPPGCRITALDRSRLDIVDPGSVDAAVGAESFDWVVNAAAYTAVDAAEDDVERATAVNAQAPASIARSAATRGIRVMQLSTDFVFDGRSSLAYRPDSPTNPLSVYGHTKLAGERAVLGVAGGVVLRTSWVYASAGRNFVLTMLKLMRERDALRVVRDQIGSPTWAGSLAAAVWALLGDAVAPGIHHFSDDGVASWYDFAVAIQEEALALGLLSRVVPIEPISSDQYPMRAVRPAFSVLDSSSTRALSGLGHVHWREALRRMLREFQERS